MSGFLNKVITSGIGELAEKVGGVIDRFVHTGEEKAQVMLELEKVALSAATNLEETLRAELGAKERVLIAELQQGDAYTKRARPTLVYFGMAVILCNYVLAPIVAQFAGIEVAEFVLPAEFWMAWGGTVSVWSIGRTVERRGIQSKMVSVISGNQQPPSMLD